ncbi:MAG: hypothetical protein K7J47_13930 [Acidobacteria bacterium]|jgi:hypothetical protein|nr:hypothetical protein [Bryobacteraceae bacterium CoA2 C42]
MPITLNSPSLQSPPVSQVEALILAYRSLADHLLADVFGRPVSKTNTSGIRPTEAHDPLISHLAQIDLLRLKLHTRVKAVTRHSTPEEILSASRSIEETFAELSAAYGFRDAPDSRTVEPEHNPIQAAQAPTASAAPAPGGEASLELQPRSAVSLALSEARATPGSFLAVLPIERFPIYQSRFGAKVADDIFSFFVLHLKRRLRPADQIFHWSPGVVLAIIHRPVTLDSVRAEFVRFGLNKIEQSVSLGEGRFFTLSMACNFAVLGVEKTASNDQIVQKIENLLKISAA